jgi:hypothetical protein
MTSDGNGGGEISSVTASGYPLLYRLFRGDSQISSLCCKARYPSSQTGAKSCGGAEDVWELELVIFGDPDVYKLVRETLVDMRASLHVVGL